MSSWFAVMFRVLTLVSAFSFWSVGGVGYGQSNPNPMPPIEEEPQPPSQPPRCYSSEDEPCPEMEHAPCNETFPEPYVSGYTDEGPVGVNIRRYCPKFEYSNCPAGLRESMEVDMSPETKGIGAPPSGGTNGAVYKRTGSGPGKVCYKDVPCALVPEVSTYPNPDFCAPCILGTYLPDSPDDLEDFTEDEDNERCPFLAWCVGVDNPPNVIISNVYHPGWDILEEDAACAALNP